MTIELLSAGKEDVLLFYEDVISELVSAFPNTKVHLG